MDNSPQPPDVPVPPTKPLHTPLLSQNPLDPPQPPGNKHEALRNILSTVAILIVAPLIALCLTAFVFQSYEVDGPSMQTTLQNHDRLIVLKIPRTWAKITHHPYVPHRGDIVIFTKADLYETGSTASKQLIKRVIGLPGERVVVSNGVITVFNKSHPNGFQPDKTSPYGNVIVTTPGNIDITVPPDEIYVCGDNRTNSLDSRIFGPIPLKDVVGKLALRIFPFNKAESF